MTAYLRFLRGEYPLLLFGLAFTFFSSFGQTFLISLFVPAFLAEFSLSNGGFGVLYAGATLVSAALLPWTGGWVDRVRLTRFTVAVVVLMAASSFLLAASTSWLMLALALVGLRLAGQGLSGHTAATAMARYYGPGRGKALSIAGLGFPLGEAFLPLLAAGSILLIGWRWSWVGVGVLAIILFGPLLVIILGHSGAEMDPGRAVPRDAPAPGKGVEAVAPEAAPSWNRMQVLRDPTFWFAIPLALLSPFWVTGIFLYQTGVGAWKGWSLPLMAAAFTAFALARVVVSLASGGLVDRFSARRIFPFYALPLAAGLGLLIVFDGKWAAFAFMACLGVTVGMGGTVKPALWAELYGIRNLGSIQSMMTAFMAFSTAGSPILVGMALDAGTGLDALLLGAVLTVAAGTLLALRVPLKKQRHSS